MSEAIFQQLNNKRKIINQLTSSINSERNVLFTQFNKVMKSRIIEIPNTKTPSQENVLNEQVIRDLRTKRVFKIKRVQVLSQIITTIPSIFTLNAPIIDFVTPFDFVLLKVGLISVTGAFSIFGLGTTTHIVKNNFEDGLGLEYPQYGATPLATTGYYSLLDIIWYFAKEPLIFIADHSDRFRMWKNNTFFFGDIDITYLVIGILEEVKKQ